MKMKKKTPMSLGQNIMIRGHVQLREHNKLTENNFKCTQKNDATQTDRKRLYEVLTETGRRRK